MKIGRNKPCACGSGRKFKMCCIDEPRVRQGNVAPPDMLQRLQEMVRLRSAAENVRQQQQGYGKPILSWTDHDFRLVGVGKTVHYGKNWLVFPDFLLEFMKLSLGREWGAREKDKGAHPIFRWLEKFQKYSDSLPKDGKLKSGNMTGFSACWLHLAYSLYLIAHNDELPARLLRRLRNPVTLMPAYFEAIVGAALAAAGFEISNAETKATSAPTPEFRAKSKTTGTVYEVEAKRKDRWKAATEDVTSPEFQKELESYLRDQIYNGSKKRLRNPIYWFELSIPTLSTEADWHVVGAKVISALASAAKTMTIAGEPIAPGFVVVTNHTFLANEDIDGDPSFALLEAIKIDDFPVGRAMDVEAALTAYDKYRDIFVMMKAWQVARSVPVTFDGSPPELLSSDGVSQRVIRIGDIVDAEFEGQTVNAKVTEVTAMQGDAVVVLTANGRSWLARMPLSEGGAKAAARYSDAIFGKDNASRGLSDKHPFDLYDFFLRSQANMTKEQVDKFFEQNATARQYKDLSLVAARIRIAREFTKWMWARHDQTKVETSPEEPSAQG